MSSTFLKVMLLLGMRSCILVTWVPVELVPVNTVLSNFLVTNFFKSWLLAGQAQTAATLASTVCCACSWRQVAVTGKA